MTGAPAPSSVEILPAPPWRRAGDLVFVSQVLPLDDDGELVHPAGPRGWAGDSPAAAQTRRALELLGRALAAAGSSMAHIVRVEAFLADAADFPDFKTEYAEVVDGELPARTTVVVGTNQVVSGTRVALSCVALATDSTWSRDVVDTVPGVPDPRAAEHAPHAVRAGPFVFCSGFPASDFSDGLAAGNPAGFPYHGSDAELQAGHILDRFEQVLAAAGSRLDLGLKVQFYESDLGNFRAIDRLWGERVGVPPTRSAMACRGFVVPGALWAANLVCLTDDAGLDKQETRAGIRWHPVDAGKANFSPGIVAGEWLFLAGQIPVADISRHAWVGAPPGLPHNWSDIELQTDGTLGLLTEQLVANGYGLGDVVDAKVYLVDPQRDFRGFARAWARAFAGAGLRPALTVIPAQQADGRSGVLVEGPSVEIDLTAHRAA